MSLIIYCMVGMLLIIAGMACYIKGMHAGLNRGERGPCHCREY